MVGFNSTWTENSQMFKLPFRKGSKTRDQIANIHWIIEKARELQKKSTSASLNTPKPFLCGSQQTGKFSKRWEYQVLLPAFRKTCMQVKKQQLEPDMEHQIGSKLGKEYIKAVYCHPAYLNYMHSTSCKMPDLMKHKLESRLPGEKSIISDMQVTPFWWQKVKRNWRAPWWR